MKEKRKYPRLAIEVDVDFSSESNFYAGQTKDISQGGVFIRTEAPLPVGTALTIRLHLEGHLHSIPGEVAWALLTEGGKGLGIGVRFDKLRAPTRAALKKFVGERSPIDLGIEEVEEVDEVPPRKPPPLPPKA